MMDKVSKISMNKTQAINFIVFIGICLALFVLFRPSLWQERIEKYLNNELNKKDWSIDISELSGHLFFNLYSDDITLSHEDGTLVYLPKASARIRLIPLLVGKIILNRLNVSNAEITPFFQTSSYSSTSEKINFYPEKFPININQLYLDGSIFIPYADSTKDVNFLIDGRITSNENDLSVDLENIKIISLDPAINFFGNGIDGKLSSEKIDLTFEKANINELEFSGRFEYDLGDDEYIVAEILLNEYAIPKQIISQLPLRPNLSKISAEFYFESDMTFFNGDMIVNNDLGLDMSGDFVLKRENDVFKLDSLSLNGNDTDLKMIGLYEETGRFNGAINLFNLDLSKWVINGNKTNLSGYVLIDGEILNNEVSFLDMNAEIDESMLFEREPSSISGGITYQDKIFKIVNPITLIIGPSIVSITGNSDFSKRNLNLDLSLTEASTFLINNFWSDSLNSGNATGSMNLFGPFNDLGITTELVIRNFKYDEINLDFFELSSELENLNKFENGYVNVKFGKGTWKEYGFESGTGAFILKNNLIEISSFELKNNNDFLQFNGSIDADSLLNLDRFQFAYRNHYLVNPKPIKIFFNNDYFETKPFEIHVDDGVFEGFIKTNPISGDLKFSNVTTELLSLIDPDYSEKIKGNIFGEISMREGLIQNEIKLNINLKDGEVANQPFSEFEIIADFSEGILDLKNIEMTNGINTGFNIKGIYPLTIDSSGSVKVDLQSNFKNINMKFFTQFSDRFNNDLFGELSGQFLMKGTSKKTIFELDAEIENTFYKGIPLGKVKGTGTYADKKLKFDQFTSDWEGNHISGSAILPLDFDLASQDKSWYSEGKMSVKTEGSFRSATFLSTFISEADSIIGDINIKLEINGYPDELIRDGEVSINNGSVYTILMDEPLSQISASAELINNNMKINSFNSSLYDSDLNRNLENNLMVKGNIDFNQFFEPKYNLRLLGDNIFFRSLNGDIEAYGDLDLTIDGKDTLNIVGTVTAKNGAIYKEFSSDETVELAEEKGRTTTNYNIRFPIEDSFSIRNSQIDAKVAGELAMSRQFESDWNYSGEINFIEGKIYYYLGDVFEDLNGSMTLDGEGFNPFLELTASTQIGDAKIMLGVFGAFDNPEWTFDSDKGYTESDILQLLTFNTRVAEEGFTTEGLGTQAQTILGAYLERELERNFFKSTGLKSTGLIEDVEISGTSELINPGQGEEFSISAKVNKNFSLSYRRSFSLEAAYKNKVGVEYKLNPNFSVIGNVDETGQVQMKFRVRRVY